MAKFWQRVEDVANMKAPLSYACAMFKTKALSVLGYVAQVVLAPKSFKVIELRAANKILRIATNSSSTNWISSKGPRWKDQ